ncbi:hypothetical protein VKT23_017007 [Stygiomarasmius scandens]|uniref:Uncharacterized protein n=1 Tax=Marasmiellus scandens TaxID=2682957 RepID=A0ABR1IXW9_9AGAR
MVANLHPAALQSPSLIERDIRRIDATAIDMITSYLARFRFRFWWPNLNDDADSLYNTAHRAVAITTFKQCLISGAYSFKSPNPADATNNLLLTQIFDHFVWYYQKGIYDDEQKKPGARGANLEMINVYDRRIRLAAKRAEFLQNEGFPQRVINLVKEPFANSDDEFDDDTGKYKVKQKIGRAENVTRFLRLVDEHRIEDLAQLGRKKAAKEERERVVPNEPIQSELLNLPREVPPDWFDLTYFNAKMGAKAWNRHANKCPALPINWQGIQDGVLGSETSWKGMSDRTWMNVHGNNIRAQYRFPSKAEMDNRETTDASISRKEFVFGLDELDRASKGKRRAEDVESDDDTGNIPQDNGDD